MEGAYLDIAPHCPIRTVISAAKTIELLIWRFQSSTCITVGKIFHFLFIFFEFIKNKNEKFDGERSILK